MKSDNNETRNNCQHDLDNQRTLNKLLKLSTSDKPLNELLKLCLTTTLSLTRLLSLEKGAIFLKEQQSEALILAASFGPAEQFPWTCSSITVNNCFCGTATSSTATSSAATSAKAAGKRIAKTNEVQFKLGACKKKANLTQVEKQPNHYALPLIDHEEQVIGVFTIFLARNHHKTSAEADFLTAAATIMSSLVLRKQAEEETHKIQEELRKTRTAFDEHAIIVFTDLQGTILDANENFCKTSQYSRDELIGSNHNIINSGHHPKSFFINMFKTIHGGKIWKGEVKNKKKDGSFYWLSATIAPLRGPSGEIERFIAMRTDITDRKEYEESLEESNRLHKKRITELETLKTELQIKQNEIAAIAYFDALTELPNRAHCHNDLQKKFSKPSENDEFAVIQIDLDRFKKVNDTLGHAAGDILLKTLGSRLGVLANEFPDFTCYRWGGDEFVAVVGYDSHSDLKAICNKISSLASVPLKIGSATLYPTVSLGVAKYPQDATTFNELMIFADLALYKTKELGRNGFSFFTPEMKDKIDSEARLEVEIRTALQENQFELYYQPQIDIISEEITGIEALIRWNHPERGLLAPGDFLSVTENCDLAPQLGRLIFKQAMQTIRNWVDEGVQFNRLALNLSPRHLAHGTIVHDLFSQMKNYNIPPTLIGIELLESYLLDAPNSNIYDTLEYLVKEGVHVELDDFGTGYASLSHLSSLPISGLKIDRTFIRELDQGPQKRAIASALISMAKLMKLRVVCEGLETQSQIDTVARIGNCSVQGYFISRPMTFEKTTSWIKRQKNKGSLNPNEQSEPNLLKSG